MAARIASSATSVDREATRTSSSRLATKLATVSTSSRGAVVWIAKCRPNNRTGNVLFTEGSSTTLRHESAFERPDELEKTLDRVPSVALGPG